MYATRPRADRPLTLTAHALGLHRRLYDAAHRFTEEHGYPPTFRELAALVELRSTSDVSLRLRQMQRAGHVSYVERSPRTLVLHSRP